MYSNPDLAHARLRRLALLDLENFRAAMSGDYDSPHVCLAVSG
jgi:hypothetical protein